MTKMLMKWQSNGGRMKDLVDRAAVYKEVQDEIERLAICLTNYDMQCLHRAIDLVPSEGLKKGKWIHNKIYYGGYVDSDWKCSECGENATVNSLMRYELTNYCPHCGAYMGEENKD